MQKIGNSGKIMISNLIRILPLSSSENSEIFMKWNLLKMAYFLGNEKFLGSSLNHSLELGWNEILISLDFISISNNFSYPFEIVVRGALFSWKGG